MQSKEEYKRKITYEKNKELHLDYMKKRKKWIFLLEYQKGRNLIESEVFTKEDREHIEDNN